MSLHASIQEEAKEHEEDEGDDHDVDFKHTRIQQTASNFYKATLNSPPPMIGSRPGTQQQQDKPRVRKVQSTKVVEDADDFNKTVKSFKSFLQPQNGQKYDVNRQQSYFGKSSLQDDVSQIMDHYSVNI